MELLLEIINYPYNAEVEERSYTFDEDGGTIGRDNSSSWVLKDSTQTISSTHAKIEFKNGSYFLTDLSSNGVFYNQKRKRLSENEMIELKDRDKFYVQNYEILVTLIKSQNIDYITVSRLINPRIENSIEDLSSITPNIETIQEPEDKTPPPNPFEDLPSISPNIMSENSITESIEENRIVEPRIEASPPLSKPKVTEQKQGDSDLLLYLFSSKLGIDIESMDKKEQIRVVNELADVILISIEQIESLKYNVNSIKKRLNISTTDSPNEHPNRKNIFSILKNPREKIQLSHYLVESFSEVKNHHTALYKAIEDINLFLSKKFSPKQLINDFEDSANLNSWTPIQKDAKLWKEYSKRYSYLNEEEGSKYSLIKEALSKKYRIVMETLRLAQKN